MSASPKFDLQKVKKIAQEFLNGRKDTVSFTAPSRSTQVVMDIILCDETDAQMIILNGVLNLREKDFAERVFQWDQVYDVYGIEKFEGHNWYVKFCLYLEDTRERIEEVSFHPVERELVLADGRKLGVKW